MPEKTTRLPHLHWVRCFRVFPTQLFYNQDLPHHLHVPWQNENGGSFQHQGNRSPCLHTLDKYPTNNEISILGCTWCRVDVKYPSSHLLNLLWLCQPGHGFMLLTCTHMPSPPQRCLEVCICLWLSLCSPQGKPLDVMAEHMLSWATDTCSPSGDQEWLGCKREESWELRTLLMKGASSEKPACMSWHKLHCSTGFYL